MPDPVRLPYSQLDQLPDRDPEETAEWRESLDAVTKAAGPHRAAYLMRRALEHNGAPGLAPLETDYVNTIPTSAEPAFPGDEAMEARITAWNRWNAAAMVTRGSRFGVGGHIATFASAAWLYETGFQHFFRGKEGDGSGDQLYIQGHASPGIYARAFLDGRLTEDHLDHFRQESGGKGLPSYLSLYKRQLPGPFQPLPPGPRHQGHRGLARLGLPGRRRDGRARVDRRARAGRPRGPGQPDLRHQLQPPAPRRPGARQLQDRSGAGGAVPRRRLERRQVAVGLGLGPAVPARHHRRAGPPAAPGAGRAVPDVRHPRRGLHPRALLRRRAGPRRDGEGPDRREDRRVLPHLPRRPRGPQGVRGVQGGRRVQGRADGDPRPDRQGLHPRPRLRVQERQPPDEEALGQGVPRDARPARPSHPGRPAGRGPGAVRPPGSRLPRGPLPPGAPRRARRPGPGPPPARLGRAAAARGARLQGAPQGVRQAGDGHHDGLRPPGQGPDAGQGDRPPLGADRPGRGPYLRYGVAVPLGRHLLAEGPDVRAGRPRPADVLQGSHRRPDPQRGDHRGRRHGRFHRRRHVVRDPRRADDPLLHLLLDVRLAAHRGPDVAARRPARQGLHRRRHRGPYDPDR